METLHITEEKFGNMETKAAERTQLLRIFPEEIWVEILNTCEDADTLIACSGASVFWRNLLEPRRTQYLFPQVLRILTDQRYLTSRHSADFLGLRLVCSNWRLGVNHLLETPPHRNSLQFQNYSHNRKSEFAYSSYIRLHLSSHSQKWIKLESELLPLLDSPLYKDGSSPFPTRTIEIFGNRLHPSIFPLPPQNFQNNSRSWDENLSILEEFLGKAGHHFWSAMISIGLDGLSTITPHLWYCFLCELVSLMPNLKSLFIINGAFSGRSDFQGLNNRLEFPEMKMLELLSMENVPESVMKSICVANSNIKICIIRGITRAPAILRGWPRYMNHGLSQPFDFGCLQDPEVVCASVQISEYFQRFPDNWNLKVLRVDLSMFPSLKLPHIFEKLETYKETLTELQLSLPAYQEEFVDDDKLTLWERSRSQLHLPKLKRLEMEVRNICSLDFLLGLGSLEYLSFQTNHNETSPTNGIPLIEYECLDFLRSNIWEKIPSLLKVEIKFNSRSRLKSYSRRDISCP